MTLTSFLWEEAKHVDGYNQFLTVVLEGQLHNFDHLIVKIYKTITNDILPNVTSTLITDPSPMNQAKASVTYNMIVEGTLAETGYYLLNLICKYNRFHAWDGGVHRQAQAGRLETCGSWHPPDFPVSGREWWRGVEGHPRSNEHAFANGPQCGERRLRNVGCHSLRHGPCSHRCLCIRPVSETIPEDRKSS